MKQLLCICLFALSLVPMSRAADAEPVEPPPELSSDYLSLVMRELYRWHLDETAMITVDASDEVEFLMRWLKPTLDEGDQSTFIELLVPQLSYVVILKKALYKVPEMDVTIKNDDYRIIKAHTYEQLPAEREAYRRVTLPKQEMMEYLFKMRSVRDYPDDELFERMRKAVRAEYDRMQGEKVTGPQTIYIAPISKVSNNLWVYMESLGKIIRMSSDTDLTSKAFWEYEKIGVRIYDLDKDVVLSLAETAGSNAFVTRDWAARVLFNCVVFGKRMVIMPRDDAAGTAESPVPPAN